MCHISILCSTLFNVPFSIPPFTQQDWNSLPFTLSPEHHTRSVCIHVSSLSAFYLNENENHVLTFLYPLEISYHQHQHMHGAIENLFALSFFLSISHFFHFYAATHIFSHSADSTILLPPPHTIPFHSLGVKGREKVFSIERWQVHLSATNLLPTCKRQIVYCSSVGGKEWRYLSNEQWR